MLVVLFSATCAYGLQRLSGKSSERLSGAILMLRMIPVMVMTIPFYLLFKQLGWINSLPALTLCPFPSFGDLAVYGLLPEYSGQYL